MILAYGVENYACFKEGAEVSFRLNKNCPKEFSNGKNTTNILCVKGANGSGKTNLLKALFFIINFCNDSFEKKPEENTGLTTYFNNNKPSHFFIEFSMENIEYRYELTISLKEIISESLYRKTKRKIKLFQRDYNKISFCINEYSSLKILKLRHNASTISTANQYQLTTSLDDVFKFFKQVNFNINYSVIYKLNPSVTDVSSLSKLYYHQKSMFYFLKELIIKFDSGVHDIYIEEYDKINGEKAYRPIFKHKVGSKIKELEYDCQSSGTKSLYIQLALYKIALMTGGLLILDEFDINFHPHILPFLLELFLKKESNKLNSQLLFTTHNTEIMDFLGKYRTHLVNKEDNESYVYRLDEVPGDMLRNDRSIVSVYNSGAIGGTPKI